MNRYGRLILCTCFLYLMGCQPASKPAADKSDAAPEKGEAEAPAKAAIPEDLDLVILNGRVMDPETKLDAVRNVGVKDGKIVAVTEEAIEGKETIDASGHVVAPGFIDLHVHGQDPYAVKLLLRDGVTTPLEIEAGAWPVEDYYDERKGKSQANYGASVAHVWARLAAMDKVDPKGLGLYSGAINASAHDGAKWSKDRSSPEQLEQIMANVEQGLRQGGLGIGFPIGYYTAVGSPEVDTLLAHRADDECRISRYQMLCRLGREAERAFISTTLKQQSLCNGFVCLITTQNMRRFACRT